MTAQPSWSSPSPSRYSPAYLRRGADDGMGVHAPESEKCARAKRLLAERGIVGDAADQALQASLDSHAAQTRCETNDRRARDYWGASSNPHHQPVRPNPDAYRVLPRLAPEQSPPSSARAKIVRQRRAPAATQRRRVHRERRPAVRNARPRTASASRDGPDDPDQDPARLENPEARRAQPGFDGAKAAAEAIARGRAGFTFPELNFILSPLFRGAEDRLEVFLRLPAQMREAAWDAIPREVG